MMIVFNAFSNQMMTVSAIIKKNTGCNKPPVCLEKHPRIKLKLENHTTLQKINLIVVLLRLSMF